MSPLEPAEVPAALRGLRIAVLVSGGIAAYKVADLVSRLAQAGCEVRVAMTAAAARFVGTPTFRALSGRPVQSDLWGGEVAERYVRFVFSAEPVERLETIPERLADGSLVRAL